MVIDPFESVFLSIAAALCVQPPDELPEELRELRVRAAWANKEPPVLDYSTVDAFLSTLDTAVRHLDRVAAQALPNLQAGTRLNVLIRLWCGCIGAAKTMRQVDAHRQGMTPAQRNAIFAGRINLMCTHDPIYAAGVEAAPTLKKVIRGELYCTDGIPAGSPVLRFVV
jgi:hypothetical protein